MNAPALNAIEEEKKLSLFPAPQNGAPTRPGSRLHAQRERSSQDEVVVA